MKCRLCGDDVEHEEYHPELCCDHFDLSCGKPLRQVNIRQAREAGAETTRAVSGS